MAAKDLFAHKSKSWDMKSRRVSNARSIAEVIAETIELNPTMHIADIGAGTGLLSFFLAQKVGKITAIDTSPSMLEMFAEKQEEFLCETAIEQRDIAAEGLGDTYDGFVSSMTIHHIPDIPKLFSQLYEGLKEGGFIALADLMSEDGSFHSDNEGVFHFGFDTEELMALARKAGFKEVTVHHAGTINKPHRDFEVFCLTGER